jgi:hypothetical protein
MCCDSAGNATSTRPGHIALVTRYVTLARVRLNLVARSPGVVLAATMATTCGWPIRAREQTPAQEPAGFASAPPSSTDMVAPAESNDVMTIRPSATSTSSGYFGSPRATTSNVLPGGRSYSVVHGSMTSVRGVARRFVILSLTVTFALLDTMHSLIVALTISSTAATPTERRVRSITRARPPC